MTRMQKKKKAFPRSLRFQKWSLHRLAIVSLSVVGLFLVAGTLGIGTTAVYLYSSDKDTLSRERIIEILSRETVLLYSDGKSQLGSLYGSEHRHYVRIQDIPENMQHAIIAAEDKDFYSHNGIDLSGVARAFLHNLIGRREGASTITMQTVKNLYGRGENRIKAKILETLNALRLERRYSKREILEFYLNQFHVTANGRGIGIAAQYYFNKEPSELTLSESAFIAGSVKGPVKYNPFLRATPQEQKKAKEAAFERKNYVLKRMLESKFITPQQYEAARREAVPFRMGKFQFNDVAIASLVRKQLSRPEIFKVLGVDDLDSLGTMGFRVTTTIDHGIQAWSQYSVRQNLSRLEMILSGFSKEKADNFVPLQNPERFEFYTARIKSIESNQLMLSFGAPSCRVPQDGIDRVAKILDQGKRIGLAAQKKRFLSSLAVGDYVLASVRPESNEAGLVCDIETKPHVQGGLIVLDKGEIAAVVGGFQPHEYNRAVFARRQPGSTFKPLTMYAGLQLGWNIMDPLLNVRSVYSFQNQFYFPKAVHEPEGRETNFAGAGATSENYASVWLFAHLADKLSPDQFRDLAQQLGLVHEGESGAAVADRLSREHHVPLQEDYFKVGIFNQVAENEAGDLSVAKNPDLRVLLRSMEYGRGFEKEMDRLSRSSSAASALNLQVMRNNYLRWNRVMEDGLRQLSQLQSLFDSWFSKRSEAAELLRSFRLSQDGKSLAYISPDAYSPLKARQGNEPAFQNLDPGQLYDALNSNKDVLNPENLMLDGVLPVEILRQIRSEFERKWLDVAAQPLEEKLVWNEEFRILVGMEYVKKMLQQMGVESDIKNVMSFPLGSNDVTLAELAMSYQTVASGKTYQFFNEGAVNQLLVIKRIEDASGQLLWESDSKDHQLVDPIYSTSMLSVLRGTVTHGTGRAANNTVILRSNDVATDKALQGMRIRIPNFGKTGTTNNSVNASYVGFLPYPAEEGVRSFNADNMFTIAAYVGYDDNKPLRRSGFGSLSGAEGALPAWIGAALGIVRERDFASQLKWKNLRQDHVGEIPFEYSDAARIVVPLHGGLSAAASAPQPEENQSKGASDLNTFIDEHAKGDEKGIALYLPGQQDGALFRPQVKVSFFKPRKVAPGSPKNSELKSTPSASSGGKDAKGSGKPTTDSEEELDYDVQNTPAPAPAKTESVEKPVPHAEETVSPKAPDLQGTLPPPPPVN